MVADKYLGLINRRIWRDIKLLFGRFGFFYIAANLIGFYIYYLIQANRLGQVAANEGLIDNALPTLVINVVLWILLVTYLRFFHIPAEIYREQEMQIFDLQEQLTPQKISANISVGYQNMPTSAINPLMAYVKNDNPQSITCYAVRKEFYKGNEKIDDRYFPSNYFKWREQTTSGSAEKVIHPNAPAAHLSLAETNNSKELILTLAQVPSRTFKGQHEYKLLFDIRGSMNGIIIHPIPCIVRFMVEQSPSNPDRMIIKVVEAHE